MKERFIAIFKDCIKREGSSKLLDWLMKSDFFTAPASTRFHNSFSGGLLAHSVNVYECLKERVNGQYNDETIAICSLLHDVCKVNFYKIEVRNRKNDLGKWEQYDYYAIDEKFPYGHGEKSVFLIERFMRLSEEEAITIRFHMGGFIEKDNYNALSNAFSKYPLSLHLHIADLESTYLHENK